MRLPASLPKGKNMLPEWFSKGTCSVGSSVTPFLHNPIQSDK